MSKLSKKIELRIRAAVISFIVGLIMFAMKMSAWVITGSSAVFSDALESIVHIAATGMALYSIVLSARPADSQHPYGHGKIEFFSAGVEGVLIISAALAIIYFAVQDFISGIELQQLDTGVVIIGVAGAVNLLLGWFLIREGRKTDSLALIADGKHVLTDSFTSIGVMIGIGLVMFTGVKEIDPIFAIFVAVNILYTGYKLVRESISGLMNEADPSMLEQIKNRLLEIKNDLWIELHELRYWKAGDDVFIDFHLVIPYYSSVKEAHAEENRISEALNETYANADIKIHFDPCQPTVCRYCPIADCQVREETQKEKVPWTVKKMTSKAIHL